MTPVAYATIQCFILFLSLCLLYAYLTLVWLYYDVKFSLIYYLTGGTHECNLVIKMKDIKKTEQQTKCLIGLCYQHLIEGQQKYMKTSQLNVTNW